MSRIAIVGRPNVGKSTLLNRLAKRRVSIVDDRPGVTRDRVSAEVEIMGRTVEIIDTGGLGITDEARLHTDGKEDVHLDQAKMLKEMTGGIANPSYVIIDPAADPKSQSPLAVKQGWIPREDKFLAFLGGAKHAK